MMVPVGALYLADVMSMVSVAVMFILNLVQGIMTPAPDSVTLAGDMNH